VIDRAWTVAGLLSVIAARGQHPAIIASGADDLRVWTCQTLAEHAVSLARGLRQRGITRKCPVALWAPNSAEWIVVALAVMGAGCVLVPIDDLADVAQFRDALDCSGAKLIFISSSHFSTCAEMLRARGVEAILIDAPTGDGAAASDWRTWRGEADGTLPVPPAEDPTVLFWTSGTTGSPKAFFLTSQNIGVNVEALCRLGIIGPSDRVLLPLPLHHAYPFIVGMLSVLSIGAPIVLPASATGPALLKALRDGEVTTIVGVPRLYEALVDAIEARIAAHGRVLRVAWRLLLRLAIVTQRAIFCRPGRFWFTPIRHAIAPRLRFLVSGGARLAADTAERLEALGWTVLSGYGLAETASLFTGSRPDDRRLASAGKPLAGGQIRITQPDEQGTGEIELRGASVTTGYLNNPEANRATFTPDGWFRTGDLGFVDRDGFLHVTGRTKEILVLGGGKKIIPEDLEQVFSGIPQIVEIALLEDHGALVALVRPDPVRVREMGTVNLREGIRVVLAEKMRDFLSYQRFSGFALTDQPLPRTRLGKYRRFLLPALYAEALAGSPHRAAREPSAADKDLLRDPTAQAVWTLLRLRRPDQALDLDMNLSLDLNLDSFSWMELTVALEKDHNVRLTEADIGGLDTIRDLLRRAVEKQGRPPAVDDTIAADVARWLAPTGFLLGAMGVCLYACNWLIMRGLFRLRVSGIAHLPAAGPFVIAPNHTSYLDGMVLAAALPLSLLRRAYWAGAITLLFGNRLGRMFSRASHVFPVDERRPGAAIEMAARVLARGNTQIWFPEGWRSPDGQVQRFLPGIGQLLLRSGASVVPARIDGTFEAWPRGRRWPRICRITLTFGAAEGPNALRARGGGQNDEERIADALRDRVVALGHTNGMNG